MVQSSGPKSATLRYDPYFFVIAFFEPGSASPSLKNAPGRLVACNLPPDGHVTLITLREIELEALTNIIKCWSCKYS